MSTDAHIVPVKVYLGTFVGLVVLTLATTGIAYLHLGIWNTVIALVIAVAKALLVILFFMHAYYEKGLTRVVFSVGIIWLAILIVLSSTDVFTRSWTPVPRSWAPDIALHQNPK